MSLRAFLRRLLSRPAPRRRRQRSRWARPVLERLEDRTLLSTLIVDNTFDDGRAGSLRVEMTIANAHALQGLGPDTIQFEIPESDPNFKNGVWTINPLSSLPAFFGPVTIDGQTAQPDWSAGRPVIDLDGSKAGLADGLLFLAGNNAVKGLIVNNFSANGLEFTQFGVANPVGNNVIQGNWIGVDASGTNFKGNGDDTGQRGGIFITDSPNNTIGGTTPEQRNVISGNRGSGIVLVDMASFGNHIEGNFIGTDASGLKELGNQTNGITLTNLVSATGAGFASNNVIGGTDAGAGNVIAGNMNDGVHVFGGSSNLVEGNYIGLGIDGLTPLPNLRDGVRIDDASGNVIGGTQDNAGNVISANGENGVAIVASIQSANSNVVQGNKIGTDATGAFSTFVDTATGTAQVLGNGDNGVLLENDNHDDPSVAVAGNTIGGRAVSATTPGGNNISGNLANGILMRGAIITSNFVQGNYIGTSADGSSAVPNQGNGVQLDGVFGALPDGSLGLLGAPAGNFIGGDDRQEVGNLISGNKGDGVAFTNGATGNFVQGNNIGINSDDEALPNLNGVRIAGVTGNVIGGEARYLGNVIAGNTGAGVLIDGGPSNLVEGNYIGVGNDGNTPVGNQGDGVRIDDASGNVIGGTQDNAGNVISANGENGVAIVASIQSANSNVVQGNKIGTDATGAFSTFVDTATGTAQVLGNGDNGVLLENDNHDDPSVAVAGNTIGGIFVGTTVPGRNIISGNLANGILMRGVKITSNFVQGNYIGTDAVGESAVPNRGNGVQLDGVFGALPDGSLGLLGAPAGNFIGGPLDKGAGNLISGNTGDGVALTNGATGNFVQGNDIGINVAEAKLPNRNGVHLSNATGNLIGGDDRSLANVIGGNMETGVLIEGGDAKFNTVKGNRVGITLNDNLPVGNGGPGVETISGASFNIIGGTTKDARNLISANAAGVEIVSSSHITVSGNDIGTDSNGAAQPALENLRAAIEIFSSSFNTIGGELGSGDAVGAGVGNVIRGGASGIDIAGGIEFAGFVGASQENTVQGNLIANSGFGVQINGTASNNHIGGAKSIDANSIHDNANDGVVVMTGKGNSILHNAIFANGGLGINLSGDSGTPGNDLLSPPELSFAAATDIGETTSSGIRVVGTLKMGQAHANTIYTIEFFAGKKDSQDAERFVKSILVKTNESGIAQIDVPLPDDTGGAETWVLATATDPDGNTSQFSLSSLPSLHQGSVKIQLDSDGDGMPDAIEGGAVNGDGNGDGTPDAAQANVVTVANAVQDGSYITLAITAGTPAGATFQNVSFLDNPSPAAPDAPKHIQFPLGFFSFVVKASSVTIDMTLPDETNPPLDYWRYGPTSDNSADHWYFWNYDPKTGTGAVFPGQTDPVTNQVVPRGHIYLHFVDNQLGDDDLTDVGIIKDAGAPGFADPFTVTNTADSGAGSLRQAILNANANPGTDVITFHLQGPGPLTIQPQSALPAITDPVIIDGTTQPGYAGTPLIALDGSQAGPGVNGLTFEVGASTVLGLQISHFAGDGILMESNGSQDLKSFQGNTIRRVRIENNGGFGIEVNDTPGNTIGNSGDNDSNVLSGNTSGGIYVHGVDASNNVVVGDLIGTGADGVTPLGNGGPGVLIADGASGTRIGGDSADADNTIAFNAGPGVEMLGAVGTVQANSIFANGGLGIDLGGDGVTTNDADESDGLQNFPVLTHVASYGGRTYLTGTLTSTPNTTFTLQFYTSAAADPSGFGEGQSFFDSESVTTDATGQATFDLNLVKSLAAGAFVTATATGGRGTSEFSNAVQVPASESLVFTVNTTDDVNDAVPDPAHFSLREAILAANSHPGQDIIRFALPDENRTIAPLSALPDITDPVIIDGTSQPGYAGLPLVELDGFQAGGADGLTITGGGSIVRGLVIHGFQFGYDPSLGTFAGGHGIMVTGFGGNRIEGNFLGTDVTGTNALPDQFGDLEVNDSPDNIIGGTTPQARNILSGLTILGADASGNRVEGNYIGTDLTGTAYLAPLNSGILISDAPFTTIGGLDKGAGNVLNGEIDIFDANQTAVQGNLIGTDVTGTVLLSGFLRTDGGSVQVGGTTPAARNIIAGGMAINGDFNSVQGNYIGTDITGTVVLATLDFDLNGNFNTIGGTIPGAGNLICSINASDLGLRLFGHDNVLQGNFIGTDMTGTKFLGGGAVSIVSNASLPSHDANNLIGGATPGAGNVIAGIVSLEGGSFGHTTVQGNFFGTDYTGTRPLTSLPQSGIQIDENNDLIGGPDPGDRNVIDGGLAVGGTGNVVQGNFVGTDVTGTRLLGNGGGGIGVGGTGNLIGGPFPGAGNVIAGNGGNGISISAGANNNVVQGNKIGTDVTGTLPLGNAGDGISITTSATSAETIGGTSPGAGNVIAFNGGRGVFVQFGSDDDNQGNDIFANGDLGLVTDINGIMSTYAEQRGLDLPHTAPVLTAAVFDPQGTVVTGTLTGTPFTRYDIDFFASDAVDASGFGDGQRYLESVSVLIDDSGSAQFQIRLEEAVPVGEWITATATATDPRGSTSMFSQPVPVVAAVDPSTVQLTAPTYLVTENGGAAVVVVTRTGSTAGIATVDYATGDGSAGAGVNYTAVSGTLTFKDGEASKTLTIPVQDDGLADGNKTFHIVLSNAIGASLGSLNDGVVTIADDNTAGRIEFATSASTVDRATQLATVEVTRTGGSQGRVAVQYQVTGGTAELGVDYAGAGAGTLTFEDGQTTAEIDFSYPVVNPTYRGPRTIEVTLGNPTGAATLGAVTASTLTITDEEDQAGAFLVDFAIPGQVAVPESDGSVAIGVFRRGNLNSFESVQYATVDGTATAGVNYLAVSGTVTFKPGESAKFFNVPILDDGIVGDPGSFQVVLSNPTGGAFIFDGLGQLTIPILDSDATSPGRLGIGGVLEAQENAGSITITVARQGGTTGTVTVDYATSDGTATAGADYTATSGTLTFNPGETSQSFTVPILPDNLVEGDETFFVTLSNPTGGATIDTDPAAVTITEAPGQFQFSAQDYKVAENNAAFTVAVTFNPFPDPKLVTDNYRNDGPWTVDYTTQDGTATAGADYTPISGTLTFYNAFPQTITIPILNDSLVEPDETILLVLSNPTGGASIGPGGTTTLTILDEDSNRASDTTPPTITGAPDRPANADGWYNAPVTVSFTATDDQSGVASVTDPVTLSGEGVGQSVTGTATDNAGNTASTTVSGINIDLTRPTTTATVVSGTPGNNGWYTSAVTVQLSPIDNLSGVKSTFYRIDGGNLQTYTGTPFSVTGDLIHTISFWSVDRAGNMEETEVFPVMIDTTAPTISIGAASADVTAGGPVSYTVAYGDANFQASSLSTANVHLIATGTASGTLSFDDGTGPTRAITISGIRGDGTLGLRIDAGSAVDLAGNPAPAAGPSALFVVDNTPPAIFISPPSASAAVGGSVSYTVSYRDANFHASTLSAADVHLVTSGSATGTLSFDDGSGATRTVTIDGIGGDGTLAIRIDAGSADDLAGNQAPAAGPSAPFTVGLGNVFVLVLDPTGAGALTVSGQASLQVGGLGAVVVDSKNAAAAVANGGGTVSAAEFDITGAPGTRTSGHGTFNGAIHDGVAPLADPLASVPIPQPPTPTFEAVNDTGQSPLILEPGTYVGGIHISGSGAVTLLPGVYYMQGGGFSVTGKASVTGLGVVIYNAPSSPGDSVNISGQGTAILTAPTTGAYQGIVLFQDRTSAVPISLTGNGAMMMTGIVYAAGATLKVTGNGGAGGSPDVIGSRYVVKDLAITGNGIIRITDDPAATDSPLAATLAQAIGFSDPGGDSLGGSSVHDVQSIWNASIAAVDRFWGMYAGTAAADFFSGTWGTGQWAVSQNIATDGQDMWTLDSGTTRVHDDANATAHLLDLLAFADGYRRNAADGNPSMWYYDLLDSVIEQFTAGSRAQQRE